ncbi:MAG: ATP-binding protein [Gemmatimonadaceae bacterium]
MSLIDAPPRASILIESMRDIGYTLETALADVIDNSISAGARTIHIHVDTAGPEPSIGISDDGRGMSRDELVDAMRLGSRNPHESRALHDLGRFGLGLKTASFSQCRRLTVVTRRKGETAAAVWDLDHVVEQDRWSLLLPDSTAGIPFVDQLENDGCLVVWQVLDRAVEQGNGGRRQFIGRVDEARSHLELVFHRYLAGESGTPRVRILLNELPLKPFDPFNIAHPATMRGQTERVRVGEEYVEITTFTLPHHRNVTSTEWDHFAGGAGYVKNQGFYLYRGKRLIVHGTWFGLARQAELTKLTRVRIDIPNSLDADWHVDVKKASARPPVQIRDRLRNLIQEIVAPSRTIYTRRGVRSHDARLPIWKREQENNTIVYRLNADNPIVRHFDARLPEELRTAFTQLIHAIGAGLPMDGIFADLAANPESVRTEGLSTEILADLLAITRAGFLEAGFEHDQLPTLLRVVEPFRSNWDRTERLLEQLSSDTND